MTLIINSLNDSLVPRCFPQRVANTVVITLLVISILGTTYFIMGRTPLVHQWPLLMPISNIALAPYSITLTTFIVCDVLALFFIVRINLPGPLARNIDYLKNHFPNQSKALDEIKRCCNEGFAGYQDHYGFYYCLALVTEEAVNSDSKKVVWSQFLNLIDGMEISSSRIDCSFEFRRLDGNLPKLVVEELHKLRDEGDGLYEILKDAFPTTSFRKRDIAAAITRIKSKSKIYVMRDGETKEVFALICLEKKPGRTLYVHTLARRAPAVKLGMTEKFVDELTPILEQKKYSRIWCDVECKNFVAQGIYQKLGFEFTQDPSLHPNGKVMVFKKNYLKKA